MNKGEEIGQADTSTSSKISSDAYLCIAGEEASLLAYDDNNDNGEIVHQPLLATPEGVVVTSSGVWMAKDLGAGSIRRRKPKLSPRCCRCERWSAAAAVATVVFVDAKKTLGAGGNDLLSSEESERENESNDDNQSRKPIRFFSIVTCCVHRVTLFTLLREQNNEGTNAESDNTESLHTQASLRALGQPVTLAEDLGEVSCSPAFDGERLALALSSETWFLSLKYCANRRTVSRVDHEATLETGEPTAWMQFVRVENHARRDLLATVSFFGRVALWCIDPESHAPSLECVREASEFFGRRQRGCHAAAYSSRNGILALGNRSGDVYLLELLFCSESDRVTIQMIGSLTVATAMRRALLMCSTSQEEKEEEVVVAMEKEEAEATISPPRISVRAQRRAKGNNVQQQLQHQQQRSVDNNDVEVACHIQGLAFVSFEGRAPDNSTDEDVDEDLAVAMSAKTGKSLLLFVRAPGASSSAPCDSASTYHYYTYSVGACMMLHSTGTGSLLAIANSPVLQGPAD